MRQIKILQISKADSSGGGASRVAEELTGLLRGAGHQAVHLASYSGKPYDEHRRPLYGRFPEIARKIHGATKIAGLPEIVPIELLSLHFSHRVLDYDLIHFHDLSSAISPFTLIALAAVKPVVWTIHDCSPFTGGCLYPMDCTRYKVGCGSCPQLGTWPLDTKIDLTRLLWRTKAALHKSGVVCITPSQWMASQAMESGLLVRAPRYISNGIDTRLYQAHDKPAMREQLGLAKDRKVIVVSSGHLSDARKGVKYAIAALHAVKDLSPQVLLLGTMDDDIRQAMVGLDYVAPGYINGPAALARYYSAADLLLFSSLADNQPLTLLECLSTGTPVVGFATGGMPEIIPEDVCGLLVRPGHQMALNAALRQALCSDKLARWAVAARQRAEALYSHTVLFDAHLSLYADTLRLPRTT